jgi:hypothetical protein
VRTVDDVVALDVLAGNNFGDTRSGSLAGPLGLLIIVLLSIATVLLIRNMNARLKRLPERFPDQDPPVGATGEEATGEGTNGEPPGSRA